MGLNFTSTKPSLRLVSSLKQIGYVATPDCLRTFGLLGAVSSFSIVHFALPLPVFVAVQPEGACPAGALSKLTESATAKMATTLPATSVATASVFIGSSIDDHQAGRMSVRISSHRIPAKRARTPPAPTTLQGGNDRKSPKHAAIPSHERIAHAKRLSGRSSNAAKFVAAYQTRVQALATGISCRSGNMLTRVRPIIVNAKSA